MEESVNKYYAAISNGQYLTTSTLARLLVSNQSSLTWDNASSVQLRSHAVKSAPLIHKTELSVVNWDSNVSLGNTPMYIPRCGDCLIVRRKKSSERNNNNSKNNKTHRTNVVSSIAESSLLSSPATVAKAESTAILWEWLLHDKIKYLLKSDNNIISNLTQEHYAALFRYHSGSSYTSMHAITNTYNYLSEIDAPWRLESAENDVKKNEVQSWRVELFEKRLARWVISYFTHHSSNTRVLSVKQIETAWPLLLLFSAEKRSILIEHAIEHYGGDALRFYNDTVIRVFSTASFILSPISPFDERVMRANELSLSNVISACGVELQELVNALNYLTTRFHGGHLTSSRAIAMTYTLCCQLLCSLHESSARRDKHKRLCHVMAHNMYCLAHYFYKAINTNNNNDNKNKINDKSDYINNSVNDGNTQAEAQEILYGTHSVLHLPEPLLVTAPTQQEYFSSLSHKTLTEDDIVMKVQDAICDWWKLHSCKSEHHTLERNNFSEEKEECVTFEMQSYHPHQTSPNHRLFSRELQECYEHPNLENHHLITPTYNNSNGDFIHEPSAFFAPSEIPQTTVQHTSNAFCIDWTKLNMRFLLTSELNMIMSNMSVASEINKYILSVISATVNKFIMPDNWIEAKHTESAQDAKLQLFIGKRKHKTSRHNDEVDSESTSESDNSDVSVHYTHAKPRTTKVALSGLAEHQFRRRRRGRHTRQNNLYEHTKY